MGITVMPDALALYERAIKIVMNENACEVAAAQSSLAASATTHRLSLDEVATAVVAVAGRPLALG